MEPTVNASHAPASGDLLVRVDAFELELSHVDADGTQMRVRTAAPLSALSHVVLPRYAPWVADGTLTLRATGLCSAPFDVALTVDGRPVGAPANALVGDDLAFAVELTAPLRDVRAGVVKLGLLVRTGFRPLSLCRVDLVDLAAAPYVESFELREATDSILVNAPERKLFDLQNPEEGFWVGTGRWRLRLLVEWARADETFALDAKPLAVTHNLAQHGDARDVFTEDPSRRSGGRRTYTEFYLDTSHGDLAETVPPEGMNLPLALSATHALTSPAREGVDAGDVPALALTWERRADLRLRAPRRRDLHRRPDGRVHAGRVAP